jgi:sugar phosphate isomerase/epimerase
MEPMAIGVMTWEGADGLEAVRWVSSLGIKTMQLGCPPQEYFLGEKKKALIKELKRSGITVTAVFVNWKGTNYMKKETIGLLNPVHREERIKHIFKTSEFAKDLMVNNLAQHIGYIPEETSDLYHRLTYQGLVDAMQKITSRLRQSGQSWLCETGQETPQTLLRFIKDVGADNLKVNFDPANLIYYGWVSGKKIDLFEALDLLRDYIGGVHCKDVRLPKTEKENRNSGWGLEVPFGQGDVQAEKLIRKLMEIGYTGPLTIEREIFDKKQRADDILWSAKFLERLICSAQRVD